MDNLTITNLAKKSHTSNASIIRLSHKVGCDGFKELKIKIIKEKESNHYLNTSIDFSFPFSPIDDPEEIKNSIADLYLNSLAILREQLDTASLIKLADLIRDAQHTFMFGIGDTGITVKSFINKVNKLNIFPIFANENGEQDNLAKRLTSNDLAIFTSYDSYMTEFTEEINLAKHQNCLTVLITSNLHTPLKNKVDLLIAIPNEEKEKKVTTFFSQFAFQYVFNIVFAFLYKNTIL